MACTNRILSASSGQLAILARQFSSFLEKRRARTARLLVTSSPFCLTIDIALVVISIPRAAGSPKQRQLRKQSLPREDVPTAVLALYALG